MGGYMYATASRNTANTTSCPTCTPSNATSDSPLVPSRHVYSSHNRLTYSFSYAAVACDTCHACTHTRSHANPSTAHRQDLNQYTEHLCIWDHGGVGTRNVKVALEELPAQGGREGLGVRVSQSDTTTHGTGDDSTPTCPHSRTSYKRTHTCKASHADTIHVPQCSHSRCDTRQCHVLYKPACSSNDL
jgi:hypothetical protein